MYRVLSASKDTYITNKIINNRYRATDANVGQAGTLDLFKLYNESTLQSFPSKAAASFVSFTAGSVSYSGKTIIIEDSVGKTVTLTAGSSNARTTEGAGTFNSASGQSAIVISTNIVAAFNAVRSGDTTKIGMTATTVASSGVVDLTQSSGGVSGNTVITGTAISSGFLRDKNSSVVENISFEGGSKSTSKNYELSRILLKFDLSKVKTMHTEGKINVGDASFKSILKLHDVYGGETTPDNFKCIVFPLAKEFDEGKGYDIGNFGDLDSTNYVTASYVNGTTTTWALNGAMKSGSLADINSIDVITSGTLFASDGARSLCFEQSFEKGTEDLEVDVTTFVSASVKDLMTNRGLLLALSGSYFVKRFASRNTANTSIRPKMIIKFNDSIEDNHENFVFNKTGSLYLSNQVRGVSENLRTGDAPSNIAAGNNCLKLKISTGSFKKTFDVSQALRGTNRITGLYSASFSISGFDALLSEHVLQSGSVTFDEVWCSTDETVTFLSSSLVVKRNAVGKFNYDQTTYHVTTINLADRYKMTETARIRVFVEEKNREVVFRKKPFEKKSQIFNNMHYRVRDFISGDIIVPFDKDVKCNKLSSDSEGMYFDFFMDTLPRGRTYVFDFLIDIDGFDNVITDAAAKFIVE